MKIVKLTKKMLNKDLEDLLTELGAVNSNKRVAFPNHVYISKKDNTTLVKNLIKKLKKEMSWASKHRIQLALGFELLNLGPNQTLENVIKPGYILVDDDAIYNEMKENGKK